jgi:hypothetical protein
MADIEKKFEDSPIFESTQERRSRSGSSSKGTGENEGPVNSAPVPELKYGGFRAEERPPLDYSSVEAFCSSSWRRFKSLWTRRFTFALLVSPGSPYQWHVQVLIPDLLL